MFGIFRCIKRTLLPTILICVFITFCPNIPPNATYIPYGNLLKPSQKLTTDVILNNAERILEGQLVGAEAFAVHKGALYTGLHGGYVVKVLPNKVVPVFKTGKDCAGIHQEHICGRPLGLRVRNDVLYIADAYSGIYSHVIADGPGKRNQLLGPNVEVNGKPAKLFNSVEVDKDGIIYLTSSSSEFDVNKGLHAMLASGTGRLLKFDPKTKKVTELLDNLLFPNGLALSSDEEYLFMSESVQRSVLKYHLKTGSVQTILEGLPGLPDNIQYAGDNTFWVSLVSPSDEEYPSLSDVLADWPNIRKFLGRALFLLEFPFKFVNEHYPNAFCEMASYHIGHLGPLFAILPDKVTIVRFDGNTGKILDALHGNNGAVKSISDVAIVGDSLYLGSPANNYIGRLALPGNLKGKYAQTEEAAKFKSDSGAQARKAAEEARARQAAEEAKVKKAAEEARAKQAAEEAKVKKVAEEAKVKKAAEEANARKAAEDAKRAVEEAKKIAEEAKKVAEARKAAEEAKKVAEEAKKVAEEAKKAAEEAKARKAAEDAKKAAEEIKAKKAAEEAKAKKAAEEARAKKAAEEANARKAAEEAKARKAAEEAKRAADAAAKAKADKTKEAEANKKISEDEIKSNKISEDTGKSKVHGDKVKTEL